MVIKIIINSFDHRWFVDLACFSKFKVGEFSAPDSW